MAVGVFVGLSTIDLIHTVDAFPAPDSKVNARSQEFLVGGPSTNAAIAFSHLGGKAALVTAVGRNRLAGIIKDDLGRYSIELKDVTPEYEGVPAVSSVWVDGRGRRSVVSVNNRNLKEFSQDVTPSVLADARILQVDGHFMPVCQAWARAARSRGVPVVLDGGSWKEGTEGLLASVDTAICSADFRPPGTSDEDQVIAYLQSFSVKQIAITNGDAPIRFVFDSSVGSIPVPHVDVADTTGAGDILHGAFCYYSVTGHDFVESLRGAADMASISCCYPGTRQWMQRE